MAASEMYEFGGVGEVLIHPSTELQVGHFIQTCTAHFKNVYSDSSSFSPLSGVPLVTCMLHVLLHKNANACRQKFLLGYLAGVQLTIPSCKSSGLSGGPSLVLLVGTLGLLRIDNRSLFCPAARLVPTHLHPLCTPRTCSFGHQRFLW